jgi:hypothetical protein
MGARRREEIERGGEYVWMGILLCNRKTAMCCDTGENLERKSCTEIVLHIWDLQAWSWGWDYEPRETLRGLSQRNRLQ